MRTKEKFRFINFRSMVVLALSLLATVFFGLIAVNIPALGFALFGILLTSLLSCALAFRKQRIVVPITCLLAAVLSAVSFTVCFCNFTAYNSVDYQVKHDVSGTVQTSAVRDGEVILVLRGVTVDGEKVIGNLEVRIDEDNAGIEFAKPNDRLRFNGKLYEATWVKGFSVNATAYRDRIRMRAYPTGTDCTLTFGEMNVLQKIRVTLKSTLVKQLGVEYGGLAYGMLTGDKRGLSAEVRDYISISGIGHILAVSGLHIGFLSMLVLFLFKRTRAWVRVLVTSCCLILYTVFVGFTVSVVRAAVMSIVGMITLINGERRDALSSLCLAMSVILTVEPIAMFDIGFIMSCSSVFGILCFARPFTRGLRKIRCPARIASAVSVSAAAQIGITPATIFFFHSVPLYSVLANIILMPLISITFILLLLCSIFALIIPPAAAVLKAGGFCLAVLDGAAYGISRLSFASIVTYGGAFVFLAYVLYFAASPFFMLPRGKRFVAVGALLASAVLLFVPIYDFREKSAIIPVNAYHDVTSIVSIEQRVYIVGDCNDADAIVRILHTHSVRKIDAVFVNGLTEKNAEQLVALRQTFAIGTVYFPAERGLGGVGTLARSGADIQMFDGTGTLPFGTVFYDGRFVGYTLRELNKDILFLGYRVRYSALPDDILRGVGVYRCYAYLNAQQSRMFITNLPTGIFGEMPTFQVSTRQYDEIVFDYKKGRVSVKG